MPSRRPLVLVCVAALVAVAAGTWPLVSRWRVHQQVEGVFARSPIYYRDGGPSPVGPIENGAIRAQVRAIDHLVPSPPWDPRGRDPAIGPSPAPDVIVLFLREGSTRFDESLVVARMEFVYKGYAFHLVTPTGELVQGVEDEAFFKRIVNELVYAKRGWPLLR